MLDKSVVLILDPRGIISKGGVDVLLRHQSYQDQLKLVSNQGQSIIIMTRTMSYLVPPSISLEIHQSSSLLGWFQNSLKWLRANSSRVKWVIAGEPWITFWICYAIKSVLISKSSLQLQVHGDFGNPAWRAKSISKRIRFLLLVTALRLSSSIRAVGATQASFLRESLGKQGGKIFVASMEYSMGSLNSQVKAKPLTLGLVGRLADDRGLVDFSKFVRCLEEAVKDFNVLVVGDGRSREQLERELAFLGDRVTFVGQKTHSEMEALWKEISILCSFAPIESFGRTSREAISRGVRVLGVESSGLLDLRGIVGHKAGLELISERATCLDSMRAFHALEKTEVGKHVLELLHAEASNSRSALVRSWL